ncbi:SGNH/GDSL hydrolase family protein [Xanthobacter agilis]|uniref:SGNH hydrolase-type esterase domain-containing protein n=1 Tax=Xanthobacter agilis TaxID=47492 RepID=A0ABU0LG22_XANAG|nr:SGNH/GDSL hydrolase family protein [Xanthobacter agilis]MDQ0506096.1 hypothetical protein [Xanthobacter agilis]
MFAALLALAAPAWADMSKVCRVPDILLTFDSDLTRTERLVDRSQPVRILLIGPQPDRLAFSQHKRSRLEVELNRRLPDIVFTIIEEGPQPGLAREDFQRIRSAIEQYEPDLVIWQIGTGDALAATDPEDFAHTLEQAADYLKGRNIDLVLIDPPFVPNVSHEQLYGRIVNQIDTISDQEKMNVVQQYAATSYLLSQPASAPAAAPAEPPPQAPSPAEQKTRLCMPELVAEAIVRAVTR